MRLQHPASISLQHVLPPAAPGPEKLGRPSQTGTSIPTPNLQPRPEHYTYTSTHKFTCADAHMHYDTHVCAWYTCADAEMHTCTHLYTCMDTQTHIQMCTQISAHILMHTHNGHSHFFMYACIHTHHTAPLLPGTLAGFHLLHVRTGQKAGNPPTSCVYASVLTNPTCCKLQVSS